MKRIALLVATVTLLTTGFASLASADDQEMAREETLVTLEGEYVWTGRDVDGDLKAEFTPTGDNTWDVSFYFDFRGEAHVYSGTAEGSLENGALSGKVLNENKQRTFTFEGTVADGKFSGDHAEIREDGTRDTGTLTLGQRS